MKKENKKRNSEWGCERFEYYSKLILGVSFLLFLGWIVLKESQHLSDGYGVAASGQETEMQTKVEGMAETEWESETQSETESETDTQSEIMSESETEALSETVSESEVDTQSEIMSERETEALSETVSESETDTQSEIISESETEALSETVSESEMDTQSEIISESETEALSETVSESETETEPVSECMEETKADGVPEPGAEHAEEVTGEEVTEQITEEMTEEASEQTTEKAAEETEKQITEKVTEDPAEQITEKVTEDPAEQITEKAIEETAGDKTAEESEKRLLPVQRGKEYEICGDENAWYRDSQDRLWIRTGSSVYVETGRRMSCEEKSGVSNVQEDGMLTFQLKQTDAAGTVVHTSELCQEYYYVDGEAPQAMIGATGTKENGVVYSAQHADLSILIEPDGKSGLKRADYCILSCDAEIPGGTDKDAVNWIACAEDQKISIAEEGVWKVYVRTEDRVGNLRFSESEQICVDRMPPEITVSGVGHQTANSGKLPIQIACRDAYYRRGSFQVTIQGANGGKMPEIRKTEESTEGAKVQYFDFPENRSYDDVYILNVKAEDLAGNRAEKVLEFSVNRFGSAYDLSPETKQTLEPYYLTEPSDIVFLETNINYVGESEIFCRENGEMKQLKRNQDYQVTMQGSRDSWKRYQYTIPAEYFQKEGIYELLLSSTDQARNESDTGLQGKRVTFALDWTAPDCIITGVEANQAYQADSVTACVQASDNVGVRSVKIYQDSELIQEISSSALIGEPVKVEIREGKEWQTLQIYVEDFAGNQYWSPEIPVLVGSKNKSAAPYQKMRESAQEKEELRIRMVRSEQKDAPGVHEEVRQRTAYRSDTQKAEGKKLFSTLFEVISKERIRHGKMLLIFGGILFAVTIFVCCLPSDKRKK